MINAGQRLKEARLQHGLSLEEVEVKTKIKKSFLAAIERGDYKSLPSAAYAKGFVQNYAAVLGIESREIMPLFKREFDEKREVTVLPEGLTKKRFLPIKRIRIRRTLIATVGLLFLVGAFVFFQYRHAFFNPALHIISPREGSSTNHDIRVIGWTDADAIVSVNAESVSTDPRGRFQKELNLFPGKNTVTIIARNRFGKETTIERHIDTK